MDKLGHKKSGAVVNDGYHVLRVSNGGLKSEIIVDDSDPLNPVWSQIIGIADDLGPAPQPEPVAALVGQRVTILGA